MPFTDKEKSPGNEVISAPVWSDSETKISVVEPFGEGGHCIVENNVALDTVLIDYGSFIFSEKLICQILVSNLNKSCRNGDFGI